jgi:hypothetical protein
MWEKRETESHHFWAATAATSPYMNFCTKRDDTHRVKSPKKKRKEKEKKKKGIDDGDWQVCVWQRQGNNEPHTGTSSRILTNNQRLFSSLAFL